MRCVLGSRCIRHSAGNMTFGLTPPKCSSDTRWTLAQRSTFKYEAAMSCRCSSHGRTFRASTREYLVARSVPRYLVPQRSSSFSVAERCRLGGRSSR